MKFIYIHGYGSNRSSGKFVLLERQFPSYATICPEWTPETAFGPWLEHLYVGFKSEQTIILVGDSTGANFAYQLKERRKQEGLQTVLILLSPLLSYSQRLNKNLVFTENLKDSLIDIESPTDAFLLIGKQDETLDLRQLNPYTCEGSELVYLDDTHRLPFFEDYVGYIKAYIARQMLILDK